MIEDLRVDGFRGLDGVCLEALGQFNLIVGPGNVGKTNLLEALFLFCSNGDASLIPKTLGLRRVETSDRSPKEVAALIDWFWSVARERPSFEIEGSCEGKKRLVRVSKVDRKAEIAIRTPDNETNEEDLRDALAVYELETVTDDTTFNGKLYVTRKAVKFKGPGVANLHGRFISPLETGQSRPLATVWSEIEDREEQDEVLALLKALDPEIVDIRIGADELGRASVRVHHARLGRMPLEFLGGGFGKALAIACYILARRDGLLLIDEFDASLHVGAQTRIIEFLLEAAERHNVQVCASTHSSETLDAFLDAYARRPKLFKGPAGLQVVQLKRTTDGIRSKTLDAERAKHLREEIGLDLRRTG